MTTSLSSPDENEGGFFSRIFGWSTRNKNENDGESGSWPLALALRGLGLITDLSATGTGNPPSQNNTMAHLDHLQTEKESFHSAGVVLSQQELMALGLDNQTIPPDELACHLGIDQNSLNLSSSFLSPSSLSPSLNTGSETGNGTGGSSLTSFLLTTTRRIFHTETNQTLELDQNYYHNATNPDFYPSSARQIHRKCTPSWDGLICWPEIRELHSITLPCFGFLNEIPYDTSKTVTRACKVGGVWEDPINYSSCVALTNPPENHDDGRILEVTTGVYFFGYCLSLTALVLAMSIFITFTELRCLRNIIHTHLMLTYIFADSLWLITSIQSHLVSGSQASCVSFILLHYFHLTNFFWMFVEGLYLYVLVVQTFTADNIKLRTYVFIGWGLPLLVVVGWSVAKWMTQKPTADFQTTDPEYHSGTCLWLTVNLWDWIYKAPAILVLAANSLFLLRIMWVLITKLRSATNPETQQSRKAAKAMVVLMPLLGITYVLVLRGSSANPSYEYIRALLISTQGFLVSLLYCFLNNETRQAVRQRWNRIRSQRFHRFFSCCCQWNQRSSQMHQWSLPRSRTESIRLYNCPPTSNFNLNNQHNYLNHRNRLESMTSGITSMTNITASNSIQFPQANNTLIGPAVGGIGLGAIGLGLNGNGNGRFGFGVGIGVAGSNNNLNTNGGRNFEPILLSPTLTSISTNFSTLTMRTLTPLTDEENSPMILNRNSNLHEIQDEEEENEKTEDGNFADLTDVDFIDSFESQQKDYGV